MPLTALMIREIQIKTTCHTSGWLLKQSKSQIPKIISLGKDVTKSKLEALYNVVGNLKQ